MADAEGSKPQLLPEWTPKTDLYIERGNLIGLIIAGTIYGVLFTIFVQCIIALRNSSAHKKTQANIFIVYSCIIFVLATFGFAGNTRFVEMTYIDYRNFPGDPANGLEEGPNGFTFAFYTEFSNVFSIGAYVIMNWFADGLMLYRFSVIYDKKPLLLILPGLIYLGIVGLSIAMLTFTMDPEKGFFSDINLKIGTAYWSLSIALNILITTAIVGRLLKMRSQVKKLLGPNHASPYTSVAAMLIESAAIYTSWAIMFLVPFARSDMFQNFVLPSLGQVQGIAPLLIILRVAQGKAWTKSTATTTLTAHSSSMQKPVVWTNNSSRGAQESFALGEVSTVNGSTGTDVKVEKSMLYNTDSRPSVSRV